VLAIDLDIGDVVLENGGDVHLERQESERVHGERVGAGPRE
jgi:hypothetical protein